MASPPASELAWPAPARRRRVLIAVAAALLGGALVFKLFPAPADGDPRRPQAVTATRFPQRELTLLGMRVRYVDVGQGPALVIVPGHTSRIEGYEGLIANLSARGFRVLCLDLPGSGYSEKPERAYSLQLYEETVLALLDALEIERCHLVGGSLGGNLVLRLALRAPARIERVVCWAPGSAWEPKPGVAALLRLTRGYLGFQLAVRVQSSYWYAPHDPSAERRLAETFAYYEEVMGPGFVRMYFDLAIEQLDSTLFGAVGQIERPVLLLVGELDDGGGMREGARRLAEEIPGAEHVVIAGARHALAEEALDELSERSARFLAGG